MPREYRAPLHRKREFADLLPLSRRLINELPQSSFDFFFFTLIVLHLPTGSIGYRDSKSEAGRNY